MMQIGSVIFIANDLFAAKSLPIAKPIPTNDSMMVVTDQKSFTADHNSKLVAVSPITQKRTPITSPSKSKVTINFASLGFSLLTTLSLWHACQLYEISGALGGHFYDVCVCRLVGNALAVLFFG